MRLSYYSTPEQAAVAMLEAFSKEVANIPAHSISIALSGGNTVRTLYKVWVEEFAVSLPWNKLHFYWVDERCVPPSHPESNYGLAKELLLNPMRVPDNHIHRIIGERNPTEESVQYSAFVKSRLPLKNGIPVFDFVFLGIGDDGHTSSIFPIAQNLLSLREPYVATINPYNGVKRVAMTGGPMLSARHTYFFVTGQAKKSIVEKVVNDVYPYHKYPASYVLHQAADACLFASF